MGIERRLLARLDNLQSVQQVMPVPPEPTLENIEAFLSADIRPLLAIGDATLSVTALTTTGAHDLRPAVTLKLEKLGFSVDSIKEEIVERLVGHFLGTISVRWDRGGL